MNFGDLLFSANLPAIDLALTDNPSLATAGIAPSGDPATAPPLHRVCDGVFNGDYSDETGVEIAKILVKHGALVNPKVELYSDSPLTAACSLRADKVALYFIELGANIHHQGCHGGTPLHWSAWCGRDLVLKGILSMKPDINKLCSDFKSTPLFWSLHGLRFGGKDNRHHQVECARLLLEHGADPSIPNFEGYVPRQLIEPQEAELIELFRDL